MVVPTDPVGRTSGVSEDMDPLELAREDATRVAKRWRRRVADWGRAHLTLALVKVAIPSLVSVALAVVVFPWFVAGLVAVTIAGLLVHGYCLTQLLKRKDAALRWAWVANKRIQQQGLTQEDAVDLAVLTIVGEIKDLRRSFHSSVARELLAAVRYRQALAAHAEQAARPQPPRAAARSDGPPAKPALELVRRRMDVRAAKASELEAEIQSYASPETVDLAMKAEEAKRSRREVEDAAMAADKAARENVRAGRQPTSDRQRIAMKLGIRANGETDVRRADLKATPEQVARGEAPSSGQDAA